MGQNRIIIDITGVVTKGNREAFTIQEYKQLVDDFMKLLRKNECMYGGCLGLFTEDDYERLNK